MTTPAHDDRKGRHYYTPASLVVVFKEWLLLWLSLVLAQKVTLSGHYLLTFCCLLF